MISKSEFSKNTGALEKNVDENYKAFIDRIGDTLGSKGCFH